MADVTKNPIQPQGSGFGRFMREFVDRAFLSNRGYDYRTGQWDRRGVRQGLIQTGAGLLMPGAGTLTGVGMSLYDRYRMNNNRRNVPSPNLSKPGGAMFNPGGRPVTGGTSLAGLTGFGAGAYGGATAAPQSGGMPISLVQLTPQGNMQTTNPGITTQGMNLSAFSGRGGPIGFSGGYTPSGASRIEGEAAQDMWAGMQQGIYGNRQFNNYAN